ncbi:MAG: hypothetical protein ACRCZQ_10855 [Bacteroidales bacterium]
MLQVGGSAKSEWDLMNTIFNAKNKNGIYTADENKDSVIEFFKE